jgi:hypothetical protein
MTKTLHFSTALLAVATLGLCSSSASAACRPIPFSARFSGSAAITGQTTTAFAGTGTATHMGHVTSDGHADITGPDGSCSGGLANVNVEVLTDAHGDTLTVTSDDVACPTGPGQFHGTGQWTVTGGTGRFSGATGQGSLDGSSDFDAGTFTVRLTGNVTLARTP